MKISALLASARKKLSQQLNSFKSADALRQAGVVLGLVALVVSTTAAVVAIVQPNERHSKDVAIKQKVTTEQPETVSLPTEKPAEAPVPTAAPADPQPQDQPAAAPKPTGKWTAPNIPPRPAPGPTGTFTATLQQSTFNESNVQQFVLTTSRTGGFTGTIYFIGAGSVNPGVTCNSPPYAEVMTITCTAMSGIYSGVLQARLHGANNQNQMPSTPFTFSHPDPNSP
jgi:hypothetical protein